MAEFPRDGTDTSPTETQWVELNQAAEPAGFVVSGYTLSDGGGTTLNVAAGTAYVGGYYVNDSSGRTVTVGSSATYDVWLNPDGTLEWASTATDAAAVSLGLVTGNGILITAITYDRALDGTAEAYKRKSSDQTSTSTSLADDNDLQFSVSAGEVWEVRGHLIADITGGANTTEIDLELQSPSGVVAGMYFACAEHTLGYGTGDGAFEQDESYTATASIRRTIRLMGNSLSAEEGIEINAIVIVGEDAGTFKVRYGRTVSGTLTVYEGSALVARRVR